MPNTHRARVVLFVHYRIPTDAFSYFIRVSYYLVARDRRGCTEMAGDCIALVIIAKKKKGQLRAKTVGKNYSGARPRCTHTGYVRRLKRNDLLLLLCVFGPNGKKKKTGFGCDPCVLSGCIGGVIRRAAATYASPCVARTGTPLLLLLLRRV